MHDDTTTVTYWYCERCKHNGQVAHDTHADVWGVYTRVMDAHHAATMGGCEETYYIGVAKQPDTAAAGEGDV